MARTLEEILQTYFGCKVPFRKDGEFTTTGIEAYKKLEELLNDLEGIGVIPSASQAVRVLDEITNIKPDTEKTEIDKAVDYVLDNIDEDDLAIVKAEASRCYKQHLVPTEYIMDCSAVTDLLEEYGQENGLSEEWWSEECDIDVILNKL